jgi:phosphoribosylamine--glycine ligase|tara:strand:+ start:2948 stop:4132 length:1185 start_codon:yes stop_codon:yes gene_type:complete
MKTKVTIIGNGGREDSLRWKLSTEQVEVESEVSEHLTIIGPEAPIAEGLTDELESKLIPVFGPSKLAGRLETSKLWAKQFMQRNDIPTAHWITYTRDDIEEVILKTHGYPFVIKEDGLCGGKGVAICETQTEANEVAGIYASNKFNSPSNKILIEDFIHGEEASCFVLTDGKSYKVLPYCQDYKRVGEGDTGPNTGGMGAYAPAPVMTEELQERVKKEIIEPTINGMQEEGIPYKGVLYIGLMICDGDPYVIEYNVRFGDPECQVLMMLMKSELLPYLEAVAFEILDTLPDPEFHDGSAMTVVMCSEGYPGEYEKGFEIDLWGHHNFQPLLHTQVFHAGVKWNGDCYVTDGGRVLNVSARGKTLQEARDRAYELAEKISWEGSFYRKDIGYKAL